MIRWIVESSLKLRLLVVAVVAATIVVGISQLREMPVEVLPDFTPTTVEVQTEALGLSAAEVEQLITVPLEQDLLNGVAFLDDIRSESVPGLSRILMVFEPGTDPFRARQVVAERLTQAHALPQVSKPPQMLQPLSSTSRLMMIGVSSKSVSPLELSVLARWTIAPRLVGVRGVANVAIWGQQERQLQVQVDPERLRNRNVTLLQVLETAANALWVSPLTFVEASTPGTGGFIDTPNQRLGIQHLSPITTAAGLARVRLEDTEGRNLRLGDVASVVEAHQPLIGDAVLKEGGGLLLVVQKFPEASALDVTRAVEEALNTMRPGLSGLEFDTTVYRPASYIERSIDNLTLALIIGAVLAVLVIAAFFRLRTALISIVVIPLSLMAATLVLDALGATLNTVVLAGLAAALVLVVDDAIIDAENIARRVRQQRRRGTDKSTATAVLEASLEVRGATVCATLVIALAAVPVFFLKGLSGAFFPDLAGAYLLALLASMVVALTVTPALSVLLLSKGLLGGAESSPLVRWLQDVYESGLSRIVHRARVAYVAIGLVFVATALAVPLLGTSLLPTFKETELLIRWDGPPGTALPEMSRLTALASRELRSIPGVRNVGAHVGRAVTGDQVVGVNSAELWVSIDPAGDYDETVGAVTRAVAGYPGLSRSVQTYSNGRVREVLSGAGDDDVVVRVYGDELLVLRRQAENVRQAVSRVDGIVEARVELPAEEPTLEVQVDLERAQQAGIKPGDARRAATTLLSGINAGSLYEQQKVFDIVVVGVPGTRDSLTSVRRLLIDTPDGGHVRLGDVADVRIGPNPAVIRRESSSRYLDVAADVSGRDRGSVVRDIEHALEQTAFPLEYHAVVLAPETRALVHLISIGIAAAIGMFLLLQAFFGSWRLATLSFLTLPVAVTGSLLAALADGGTLSFGSLIALFAVLGLAARNGVLLMDRFRRLEQHEGHAIGPGLVLRGARERLAPILATALTTASVLVPVVILGNGAGYELLQPLAIVLLGGLVTSTLVNLAVLPVLYVRFGFSRAVEGSGETAPEELAAATEHRPRGGAVGGVVVTETRAAPNPGRD